MNLLPCQHEELVSLTFEIVDFGDTFALQVCRKCLLSTVGKTEEQAAEAWNTRAGWISVDERLPDRDINIMLVTEGKAWWGFWDGHRYRAMDCAGGWLFWFEQSDVTYWRPLPAPPESE